MSRKRSHEDASEEAGEDKKDDVFVFYEHTDLSSIPNGITSLRIDSSVRKIPANAFDGQSSLTTVEYEEGLQVIGKDAFYRCLSLREQHFPSTLVEIGERAFGSCKQLESVGRLPLNLKIIKEDAFKFCEKLRNIEVHDGTFLERAVFSNCLSLTHCRLPEGMLMIPESLFYFCRSLKYVNVPSSVLKIGAHAFCCAGPCLMTLPTGLSSILESAFFRSAITQLDLSGCNALSSIERFGFLSCPNLKDVILPRTGLKRIEEGTFQNCASLTHLWIPPTVEYVDRDAFVDCSSLLSIEVPETLERLVFVFEREDYDEDVRHWRVECGYESLVNIYIPPTHQLDKVHQNHFMKEMKLRKAERNYEALVGKLKVRFDSLPLHRACYFQSYHSLEENVEMFHSILRNKDGPDACERVDFLGMTPFHILSLSHRPQLTLFQELLSVSSVDITKCRDVFGATPSDYLCKNESPEVVCVTKSLLANIMEARVSFLGLPLWKKDVMSSLEEVQMAKSGDLGTEVTSLCQELEKYERMESLSLLEMSIWRLKVESERATGSEARERCRISCGSRIMLEHVMPFLENERAIDDSDGDSDGDDGSDSSDELDDDDDDGDSGDEMDDGDY